MVCTVFQPFLVLSHYYGVICFLVFTPSYPQNDLTCFWFFVTLHYEIISSLPTQEVAKVGQRICLPITHFSPVVTYFLIIDNSQNPEINIDTILLTLVETLSQLFHWSSFSDPGFKPGSHIASCFLLS